MWATVGTVVLVAYLLSPGLFACAMRLHWEPPETVHKPLALLYLPLVIACKWDPVGDFYSAYLTLCAGESVDAHVP